MADYHPLITRAVTALEKDTAENRRVLYERARTALVAQLRGTIPPIEEAEITRERLALEEAIRKVEVESARRVREAPRADSAAKLAAESARREERAKREEVAKLEQALTASPPAIASPPLPPSPPQTPTIVPEPAPSDSAQTGALSESARMSVPAEAVEIKKTVMSGTPAVSWPQREAGALLDEALKEFRDVVGPTNGQAEVAKAEPLMPPPPPTPTARPTNAFPAARLPKQPYAVQPPRQTLPLQPSSPPHPAEPRLDLLQALESFEPRISQEDWQMPPTEPVRPVPATEFDRLIPPTDGDDAALKPPLESPYPPIEDRVRPPRSLRSYRRPVWMLIALVVICGAGATVYWQGKAIVEAARSIVPTLRAPTTQVQREAIPSRPKITERVGQPDSSPSPRTGPEVSQRAMLTTEPDAKNPRGKDYVGRAVWRTQPMAAAPGRAAELAIKLDVEIPDRGFAMSWLIRRNTDATLPATHTIDIEFNLAPNSPLGRITEIKSMLMKENGQVDGVPLWGHAQRSTPTYFLVGLSAVPADAEYNLKLLREKPAFDIAMVFSNVGRAFLLIEKGPAGQKAFAEAFAAWKQ